MAFLITTTGVTSSVIFDDLGRRIFNHPTTDFDLETEFNISDIRKSNDVDNSLSLGYITATYNGVGITSSSASLEYVLTSDYRLYSANEIRVKKNPGVGEFSSIKDAINTITTNSSSNPFTVNVGPGVFTEDTITVKSYITLKGSGSDATIIKVDNPNKNVIVAESDSLISDVSITGATSSGSIGIYHECYDIAAFNVENVVFLENNILMKVVGLGATANCIALCNNVKYGNGNYFDKGFIATSDGVGIGRIFLKSCTTAGRLSDVMPSIFSIADQPGCQIIMSSVQIRNGGLTASGIGIQAENGGILRLTGVNPEGFDKAIYMPNIGTSSIVRALTMNFSDNNMDVVVEHPGAVGKIGFPDDITKLSINSESGVFIPFKNLRKITVGKKGADFKSIKDACDAIAGYTGIDAVGPDNPYLISVDAGEFIEPEIYVSSNISIVGSSIETTIVKPDSDHDIFHLTNPSVELSFMNITGATSGKAGIFIDDCGDFTQAHKLTFNDCDTGILVQTTAVTDTQFYGEYIDFNGVYSYGVKVISATGFSCFANLENYYNFPDDGVDIIGTYINGPDAECHTQLDGLFGNEVSPLGTGFFAENGAKLMMSSVMIQGFDTAIKSIGANLNISSTNLESCATDLDIDSSTIGTFEGVHSFIKTSIGSTSSFTIIGRETNVIKVDKSSSADFSSVKDAMDYITGNTSTNRFTIDVGVGTFLEDTIVAKDYVTIRGKNRYDSIISVDANGKDLFSVSNNFAIRDCKVIGGTFSGDTIFKQVAGVLRLDKVLIGKSNVIFDITSTGGATPSGPSSDAMVEIKDLLIDHFSNFTTGFKLRDDGGSGFNATNVLINDLNWVGVSTSHLQNFFDVSGEKVYLSIEGVNTLKVTPNIGNFLKVNNGSEIIINNSSINNFSKAIWFENSGTGPKIRASSIILSDNDQDVVIDNTNTTGSILGILSESNSTFDSPNVSVSFTDPDGHTSISGQLHLGYANNLEEVSTLIVETPTMGVLEGGEISDGGGLVLNVGTGFGYIEKFPDTDVLKKLTWGATYSVLSASSSNYIYIDQTNNILSSSSQPETIFNILLGRVVTGATSIDFIDASPLKAEHNGNRISDLARKAFGSIYVAGSIVTENITPFELDISSGNYYYAENSFSPSGGTAINFTSYYQGTSGFIKTLTNSVDNVYYDGGTGSLAPITSSWYAKHSLYIVGDGINEKYFLVYAQNQYFTLLEAQEANIPTPPNYFIDGVALIAGIIVQQGTSSITQIRDQRPVIGFKASGINASALHGSLLGLSADDHTQYLLVSGTRAMSGALNMNNNNISNVNTINNFSPSSWIRSGGNGFNTNSFIGLTDSFSLGIRTNNTDRISIANTGEVTLSNLSGSRDRLVLSSSSGQLKDGSSYIGQSSIITVGTISNGVWRGTAIGATFGGTGQTTYTVGDLLQATGSSTLGKLSAVSVGNALISGGVGTVSSWGKIGLTTHISGTLQISNGGTGQIVATSAFNALSPTTTKGDIIVYNGGTNVNLPVGSNGQTLTPDSTTSTGLKWATPSFYQATPADPTTTTSTVGVMMGLSGLITPVKSGIILIHISGDVDSNTSNRGVDVQIRTGTGAAPANGDALTGTTRGSSVNMFNSNNGQRFPFGVNAVVSGLSVGTQIWIDISISGNGGAGTSRVRDISISAIEI